MRERAATTYSRRLEAFAVSKQIKERSAKNRQVLLENERIAKFKIHREVEKKQQVAVLTGFTPKKFWFCAKNDEIDRRLRRCTGWR